MYFYCITLPAAPDVYYKSHYVHEGPTEQEVGPQEEGKGKEKKEGKGEKRGAQTNTNQVVSTEGQIGLPGAPSTSGGGGAKKEKGKRTEHFLAKSFHQNRSFFPLSFNFSF